MKKNILFASIAVVIMSGIIVYFAFFYQSKTASVALENKTICFGVSETAPTKEEEATATAGVYSLNFYLMKQIAEDLGLQMTVRSYKFKDIYVALENGDIDCFWSGVNFEENQGDAESIIYSVPYLSTKTLLVKRSSDNMRIDGIENTIKVGYVQGEHTYFDYLSKNSKDRYLRSKFEWVPYDTYDELYGALVSANLDALVDTELYYNLRVFTNNVIEAVKDSKGKTYYFEDARMGVMFNRYSTDLKAKIDAELKQLSKSGFIKQLANKYIKENADCVVDLS